jgi:hypothetical protein
MKGRITANQGESRYTVAVDADTALLQILITEKEKLKESILQVLYGAGGSQGLYAQKAEYESAYDAAMQVVYDLTDAMNEELSQVTVNSCINAAIAECNAAYSDTRQACRDTAVACRNGCDGSLECLQACDDAEDICESAAERVRDACYSTANLNCVDYVTTRNTEIFARYSPLIAGAQARAIESLAPLEACRTDIAYWESQRLSVDQTLTQLREIEARGIAVTCWSAQYDDQIAIDTEVEIAQTPSGRHVITAIGEVDNCLHDSRAVPAYNLFVNAAINPGVETWRPRWRTGIVKAINGTTRSRSRSLAARCTARSGRSIAGARSTVRRRKPILTRMARSTRRRRLDRHTRTPMTRGRRRWRLGMPVMRSSMSTRA